MDLSRVNDSSLHLRPATEHDRTYMVRLHYLAMVMGDEFAHLDESNPTETAKYVNQWSPQRDGGVIAVSDLSVPAGGAWLRYFTGPDKGSGYLGALDPKADPADTSQWLTSYDPVRIPELAIAVERRYAGRGLGAMLIDATCELAKSQQAPAVCLWVDPNNPRARRLYEAQGFIDTTRPDTMVKFF
ncbi:MAG: GNAT family N-acetyltransferase [Corynebacterium sp.]|nr:GNAT family N-acetyltransferase [Corynebacterium sp.]